MNWTGAMPLAGLTGGLLIGLAGAIMLLGLGIAPGGTPWPIATAFVMGLPFGALLVALFAGPVTTRFPVSIMAIVLGGLIVGFGTRMGSGCTSGHGVCGVSRLSPRSIAATVSFMAAGFVTVAVMRMMGVAW
jgi:uncharacterized membrane protein YedE/YeeE